jgi:hypothetical protein
MLTSKRSHLRRWQIVLLCVLAFTVAFFSVTRFVDFSGSFFTVHHVNPASGVRSVALVDHMRWVAPRVEAVIVPAAQLISREPLPPQPFNEDLYNRPPPVQS